MGYSCCHLCNCLQNFAVISSKLEFSKTNLSTFIYYIYIHVCVFGGGGVNFQHFKIKVHFSDKTLCGLYL